MSRGPWKTKGDARAYPKSHVKIPPPAESAHILLHFLYRVLRASKRTLLAIEQLSGVSRMTLYEWMRKGQSPRLDNFEAVLNAAGFGFQIVAVAPEKLTVTMLNAMEAINAELAEMRELMNDDIPESSAEDAAAAESEIDDAPDSTSPAPDEDST